MNMRNIVVTAPVFHREMSILNNLFASELSQLSLPQKASVMSVTRDTSMSGISPNSQPVLGVTPSAGMHAEIALLKLES